MKIYSPKTSPLPWSLNTLKERKHKTKQTLTVDEYGNTVVKQIRVSKIKQKENELWKI